ncbi:hypothetical protein CHLRE_03g195750v5 [Chlamydomonas reinhardtii]|uniref:Uncharacterized protein n=1 Tax=Chlamydomonas reinhardtii TaxID=3055 RepID=A0A2K3DYL9_CHLRE|nr:uncharacterized protein CHLRE_03g195750v5 [Chlamydomonas reinhardtii]PNW85636.1 hypothetical protein CHLRE_03g195750v5 [Chlamydomonas reinhardtii]
MNRRLLDPFQSVELPEIIEEFLDHGSAQCMAFNRRGTLLASGTKEGQVVIWDFDTRGVAAVLNGHTGPVSSVSWSRNGRQLLSGSEDASVILWDVQQGKQVLRLQLGSAVLRVSLHPRGPPFPALAALAEGPPVLLDLSAAAAAGGPQAQGEGGRTAVEPLPLVPEAPDAAPAPGGRGRGANADAGGAGPGSAASGGLAVFSKSGDVVIGGQMRGALTVVDTATRRILDIVRLPNSARVTDLVLNRKGDLLLATCQDQRVRMFELAPAVAGRQGAAVAAAGAPGAGGSSNGDGGGAGSAPMPAPAVQPLEPPTDAQLAEAVGNKVIKSGSLLHGESGLLRHVRDFQNAVERTPWRTAAFSADSEHVVGATAAKSQLLLYIWNRPLGNMERILEGPKEGVLQLAWHPLRSLLLSCAGTGRIYIWAKVHAENWSAFAPDFKELDENTEYVEREDEFDWNTPGAGGELGLPMGAAGSGEGGTGEEGEGVAAGAAGGAGEEVDVFSRERLHYFSSDEEDEGAAAGDELLYLPVVIERELTPAAGRSEGGEGEDDGGDEDEEEPPGLQGVGGGVEASLAAGRLAQFPRRGGGAGGSNGVAAAAAAAARGAAGEDLSGDEEMRDVGADEGAEEGAGGGAVGGGGGGGAAGGRKRKVQFDEGTLGR